MSTRIGANGLRAAVALVMLTAATAFAELAASWPQWRGPAVDGVSTESDWEACFPDAGPKITWQRDVGIGYAAVAVTDGRVYTVGWRDGQDVIQCLAAENGEPLWERAYHAKQYNNMHDGGPAATPAIDQDRVYTVGREAQLVCLDADNGDVLWEKQLTNEYGLRIPSWGFSGSPIILGNVLFIDADRVFAFNKNSGEEIWKTKNYEAGYSTPIPFIHNGRQLVAVFPAYGLVVLNASSGDELASHRWETKYKVNAASPIIDGDRIFISSGYNTGGAVLQFDGRGLRVVWENREMRNQMSGSVLIDGYLYGFDDNRLKCVDFETGERQWDKRGLGQGALMAAGGKLIIQGERGELVIAEATPEGFEPISSAKVLDAGKCWIMPVLAGGRIYCRSSKGQLVCVDVSGSDQ